MTLLPLFRLVMVGLNLPALVSGCMFKSPLAARPPIGSLNVFSGVSNDGVPCAGMAACTAAPAGCGASLKYRLLGSYSGSEATADIGAPANGLGAWNPGAMAEACGAPLP